MANPAFTGRPRARAAMASATLARRWMNRRPAIAIEPETRTHEDPSPLRRPRPAGLLHVGQRRRLRRPVHLRRQPLGCGQQRARHRRRPRPGHHRQHLHPEPALCIRPVHERQCVGAQLCRWPGPRRLWHAVARRRRELRFRRRAHPRRRRQRRVPAEREDAGQGLSRRHGRRDFRRCALRRRQRRQRCPRCARSDRRRGAARCDAAEHVHQLRQLDAPHRRSPAGRRRRAHHRLERARPRPRAGGDGRRRPGGDARSQGGEFHEHGPGQCAGRRGRRADLRHLRPRGAPVARRTCRRST